MAVQTKNITSDVIFFSDGTGTSTWVNTTSAGFVSFWTNGSGATVRMQSVNTGTYGFSIPSGATIVGIEIVIGHNGEPSPSFEPFQSQIFLTGSSNSTPKSFTFPNTDAWVENILGGPTDTWGKSWTPAEINASSFGITMRHVDDVYDFGYDFDTFEINVYYSTHSELVVQDSSLGIVSEEAAADLPGSEGSVVYGGWGSFFAGSSYAGSGSGFTQAELGVYGSTVGISSDEVTLAQDTPLTVQDSTIGISSDAPLIVMDIPIIVQESFIGISSDEATIDATVAVTLPDGSIIGITSDSPSLQQHHHLVVSDASIGVSSDVPLLAQEHFLVVGDSVIAVSSDTPAFLQDYHIIVQEALIGVDSDVARVLISFRPGDIDTGEYTPQYEGTPGELVGVVPVAVDQYTPQAKTTKVWDEGEGVDTGSWTSP